jgi:[acyl-carrier-protein] S-malonyltransferase
MLADALQQLPAVAETFAQASDVLGFDARDMALDGPEEALNQTANTQPMLLCASVALWRAWGQKSDVRPAFLAGHSLGEYSALVCSGVLDFSDALSLVQLRGRLMQEAVAPGEGAMAAILGLDDEAVEQACTQAETGTELVSPANYNSPGQVVIAGSAVAVERAVALAKEAGAKRAMPLAVSVPSHCALMKPAAEQLQQALADTAFAEAQIPVVHNVDGQLATDADTMRDRLAQQLYSPVRWSASVQWLAGQGVGQLLECGPGKVLAGLAKRIDRRLSAQSIEAPDTMTSLSDELT